MLEGNVAIIALLLSPQKAHDTICELSDFPGVLGKKEVEQKHINLLGFLEKKDCSILETKR